MAELLLKHDADTEVQRYGQPMVNLASNLNKYDCLKLLIKRGAHLPDDLTSLTNTQKAELGQIRADRLGAIASHYNGSKETADLPTDLKGLLLEFHDANTNDKVALNLTN